MHFLGGPYAAFGRPERNRISPLPASMRRSFGEGMPSVARVTAATNDRRCLATPQQKRELAFESSWRKTVGMNPPLRQREVLHLGMRVKIRKRQQTLKQDRGHAGLTIPPHPAGAICARRLPFPNRDRMRGRAGGRSALSSACKRKNRDLSRSVSIGLDRSRPSRSVSTGFVGIALSL